MTTISDNTHEEVNNEITSAPTTNPAHENIDVELENKLDEHDMASAQDHEEEEITADFSKHSLEQLNEAAVKASKSDDIRTAHLLLKEMRTFFDNLYSKTFNEALQHFIEQGNLRDDFAFKDEYLRKNFYEAYRTIQHRRAEMKALQDAEKLRNLEEKKKVLAEIHDLTEKDLSDVEMVRKSLEQLKDLQKKFKDIRNTPMESREELWSTYHVYLNRFYDKLDIYNELITLDREKNLDQKIELIKKVMELVQEPSLNKAQTTLNKYHEDWKNIGPAPKESSEDIWQRFKAASDLVYEKINAYRAEMDGKREENLVAKTALCEKAESFITYESDKAKEWIAKTKELESLFEEWRAIGPVPRKFNQSVWDRFKQAYNQFYTNKNNYFKFLNNERAVNLKTKTELCEKAEELMNSIEWNKATKSILELQDQWKKSGPVHEKQSDKIWKRFRAACDTFFNRKAGHFEHQVNEQKENLAAKTALLTKLDDLKSKDNVDEVLTEVKSIQAEWNRIGFVPMAQKEDMQKRYNEALNAIYGAFKMVKDEMRAKEQSSQYELMAASGDGKFRLQKEERFLMDKIRKLKGELATEQNNMGFFANSKNASSFIQQIENNLKNSRAEISKLEEKLKMVRGHLRNNTTA
ncbi:MAG: DUF349 domain-containing protein [Bacteroidia bacterium]|nr:DUF349 domain-containing protein [Bacteroidia bacterium]MBP7261572.1 DUF349 domain-containing protein [Bacteroidia bacterium]MBP9181109.1 DUF349 domain-containing protein [Bacteroidia bacterium]MBP9724607.1 DUF349 domain-containing protein [Bacteroidia bacterium]